MNMLFTWQKRITIEDEVKITNQFTLRGGEYHGLSTWVQYIH